MTSCLPTMIVTSYLFSFIWPYIADPTALYVNILVCILELSSWILYWFFYPKRLSFIYEPCFPCNSNTLSSWIKNVPLFCGWLPLRYYTHCCEENNLWIKFGTQNTSLIIISCVSPWLSSIFYFTIPMLFHSYMTNNDLVHPT